MQQESGIILLVQPYGHVNEGRRQIERIGLDQYFSGVNQLLVQHRDKITQLIVRGGLMENGVTEATSVADELRRRLTPHGIDIPIQEDSQPTSTISIIEAQVRETPEGSILWVTSDHWRALKTLYLVAYYRWKLKKRFKFWVFWFMRADDNPRSNHLLQLIELIAIMVLGPDRVRQRIERNRQ